MMTEKYNVLMGPRCEQSGYESRTIEEVKMGVLAGDIVYEAIMGEIVPVYDYDEWVSEGVTLESAHKSALSRGLAELQLLWGESADIFTYSSSGQKIKGDKVGPFVSLRFIVRKVGKFASGADMKLGGYVPDMFDQSVYKAAGKRQLMRLWGASKYGEDRPMCMLLKGKPTKLQDFNNEHPDSATYFLEYGMAQNVGRERLIEVKAQRRAQVSICEREAAPVALGANGLPLGEDIQVTPEGVRELCMLAGWFHETNRGYDRWRDEMWLLQNTATDFNLGEALDELMLEVSGVCSEKHSDGSVESIKRVTMNRPEGVARKNLGQLRAEACKKDEGGYLRWLDKVKMRAAAEVKGDSSVVPERVPYLFNDHNAFVGKTINQTTADEWLGDAIVMIMNGGEPYFLTRNKKTCMLTNREFEAWGHAKEDKLLRCLDVNILLQNPYYDEEVAKVYEMKKAAGSPVTAEESKKGVKFRYTTFGAHHGKELGYVADQIYQRKVRWCGHEDFIPYLARRVPDAEIARAIRDPVMFNKFRGFPIEAVSYKAGGKQFLGSAWHAHLMNDICHGDVNEWKHLEGTIADMIQRPYRVSNVAHVFQGAQGTGKSFMFRFMSDLLGASYTMLINDMNVYMQRFNDDQSAAILKVFEEVRGKGDQFINNDRLKADITKPVIRIEVKGGSIMNMRHCARYWMLTNHRDTLHIESDDRRYVYHSVSGAHADNWDYFAPIVAELKDVEYIRACFEYFAELQYDEHFVMSAIGTAYKNEQKLDSMCLSLKFLKEWIEDDGLAKVDPMRKDGDKVASSAMYEAYQVWCGATVQKVRQEVFHKSIAKVGIEAPKNMRIQGTVMKALVVNKDVVRSGFREAFKMPNFDWTD